MRAGSRAVYRPVGDVRGVGPASPGPTPRPPRRSPPRRRVRRPPARFPRRPPRESAKADERRSSRCRPRSRTAGRPARPCAGRIAGSSVAGTPRGRRREPRSSARARARSGSASRRPPRPRVASSGPQFVAGSACCRRPSARGTVAQAPAMTARPVAVRIGSNPPTATFVIGSDHEKRTTPAEHTPRLGLRTSVEPQRRGRAAAPGRSDASGQPPSPQSRPSRGDLVRWRRLPRRASTSPMSLGDHNCSRSTSIRETEGRYPQPQAVPAQGASRGGCRGGISAALRG